MPAEGRPWPSDDDGDDGDYDGDDDDDDDDDDLSERNSLEQSLYRIAVCKFVSRFIKGGMNIVDLLGNPPLNYC